MRERILRFLGLDEWKERIEAEVGLCKIRVEDANRALMSENAFLRAQNTTLLALVEKKGGVPEQPKRMTIRQEIAERTRLAFEEDEKLRSGVSK